MLVIFFDSWPPSSLRSPFRRAPLLAGPADLLKKMTFASAFRVPRRTSTYPVVSGRTLPRIIP